MPEQLFIPEGLPSASELFAAFKISEIRKMIEAFAYEVQSLYPRRSHKENYAAALSRWLKYFALAQQAHLARSSLISHPLPNTILMSYRERLNLSKIIHKTPSAPR